MVQIAHDLNSKAITNDDVAPKESFITASLDSFITASSTDDVEALPALGTIDTTDTFQNHDQLLQDAELHAEHQARARLTMLDLRKALAEANWHRSELARLLKNEQQCCAELRSKCEDLELEVEELLEEQEKRQAEALLKKGFEKKNTCFLGMMLEKSREAYQSTLFSSVAGENGSNSGRGELAAGQFSALGTAGAAGQGSAVGTAGAAGQVSAFGTAGDTVTFSWIIKLWRVEVDAGRQRRAAEAAEKEKQRLEEERRRKMQEEIARRVGEVQKQVDSLAKQLDTAKWATETANNKIKKLEKLLEAERAQMAERERELLGIQEQLKADLRQKRMELSEMENNLQALKQELKKALDAVKTAADEHENEKKQLQESAHDATSELQQALAMAKYMRELALKAKRDAASSVSPEKFSQLIAQLEAMKTRLNTVLIQHDREKSTNLDLMAKLDKNKRRLELERQFLPLIRQCRGPLGEKGKDAMDLKSKRTNLMDVPVGSFIDAGDGVQQDRKLHRSQSLYAHGGPKGFALNAMGGS